MNGKLARTAREHHLHVKVSQPIAPKHIPHRTRLAYSIAASRGDLYQAQQRSGQIAMTEHPRITLDPKVLAGKPVIRGTRLSVEFVIGLMAEGWSELDILGNYPGITHDDIIACLAYARDTLSSEKVFPSAA